MLRDLLRQQGITIGRRHVATLMQRMRIEAGVAISRDGKGSWRDNVFVQRLWRSVKYEEVALKAYNSVGEARTSIGRYLTFYNGPRPHSSLDRKAPNQAHFTQLQRPEPGGSPPIKPHAAVQTTAAASLTRP